MNRLDHILQFEPERNLIGDDYGLIAAYCFCLSSEDACKLLLESRNDYKLRRKVLRKVCYDLEHGCKDCHLRLISDLLSLFDTVKGKDRQRISQILSSLYGFVPRKEQNRIRSLLIGSKFVTIRRYGYKIISKQDKINEKEVISAWNSYQDPECAWLIIKKLPHDYLIENRHRLVTKCNEKWHIERLYLRIGECRPDLLAELKVIDPVSYCYVAAKLGLNILDLDAEEIVLRCAGDERFGLIVWSFGRMGMWNLLEQIESQLSDITNQQIMRIRNR